MSWRGSPHGTGQSGGRRISTCPWDELLRGNEARPRADHVPEEYIRSSWKRFHHVMFRPLNPEDPNGNLLKRMIADPYVRVTPVRGESDVFACNFTREAFLEGRWNTRTINAAGSEV